MTNDGRELTFTVDQFAPGVGTFTINAASGTWPVGTYSFNVVAWYTSVESLDDYAGFNRTAPAAWTGTIIGEIPVNSSITITWTASNRIPDHYSVYYVENATMVANGTQIWRKIAEVNGDILTATITDRAIVTNGISTNFKRKITTQNIAGTTLIDATPDEPFKTYLSGTTTYPVKPTDSVSNITDASSALVTVLDSDTQLTTTVLTGGGNTYEVDDEYCIHSSNVLQAVAETFITDLVVAGYIVILNAGSSTQDAYGTIAAIPSETVLVTTGALSESAAFVLNDTFDIIDAIFIPFAAARSVVVNPIKDQTPDLREAMIKSYNGIYVRKSYVQENPMDYLRIEAYTTSFASLTDYKWFIVWQFQSVRLEITQSSGGSAIINPIHGYVRKYKYMGDKYKNTNTVIEFDFYIEIGAQV